MKNSRKLFYGLAFALLFFVFVSGRPSVPVYAEDAQTTVTPVPTAIPNKVNVSVDYMTGQVRVTAGQGGSNKLYFSTDKKKTWELIENLSGTLDISGFMKTSAVTLYFKGNKDPEPVEFVIPAEDKSLKVTYSVVSGAGTIAYSVTPAAIEFRAGPNGNWNQVPTAPISTTLYEVTGTTLQFRLKATTTSRAGKIISLKVAKRPKAPSVKVDASKLELSGLKGGGSMQYRLNSNTVWIPFAPTDTKAKSISLTNLLVASGAAVNTPIPSGTIEVRVVPTGKNVASAIRTIEIEAQRAAPTTEKVKLEGTTLTITDASSAKPYEYLMLSANKKPDLSKDKWKSVTSSKPQVIKKTGTVNTIVGDVLFVREKAVKNKTTGLDNLASLYISIPITSITGLPSAATPVPSPNPSPGA